MKRNFSLLVFFSLIVGCTAEPGTSMQLVHVVGPDTQCTYNEEGKQIRPSGFYDPSVSLFGGMPVTLRLRNTMNDRDADSRVNDANASLKPNANDVVLSGFNVCYLRPSAATELQDGSATAAPEGCTGTALEFIGAGASVYADPEGQSQGQLSQIVLFSDNRLTAMFGDEFDAQKISVLSSVNDACVGQNIALDPTSGELVFNGACTGAGITATYGVNATASGWGSQIPAEDRPSMHFTVMMQAVGTSLSGMAVQSNWFSFPVELCVGCLYGDNICALYDADGDVVRPYVTREVCSYGTCPGLNADDEPVTLTCAPPGSDGTNGCPTPDTACSGVELGASGYRPVWAVENGDICDLSQRLGAGLTFACSGFDTCAEAAAAEAAAQ